MTSPSSSDPASEWSVNQVKKLSGSSCCLFLPALFGAWPVRFVRSLGEEKKKKRQMKGRRCQRDEEELGQSLQTWPSSDQSASRWRLIGRFCPGNSKRDELTRQWSTHLPGFPFDLSRLGNGMSALADVELFGEDFVVEARVLVEELQERRDARQRVDPPWTRSPEILTNSIL